MPRDIKIALFGARANNAGLGNQTREFFDHIKPDVTLVVDISEVDGKKTYPDRFIPKKEGQIVETYVGFPDNLFVERWVEKHKPDLVYCVEIPYNYHLFEICRMRGIKTILNYNYEFLDYLQQDLPLPDLLLAPSKWHIEEVERLVESTSCKVVYMPYPVNRLRIKRRNIRSCKKFVHIAGYELFEDRNGTQLLLDSLEHIKSDVKIVIYSQHELPEIKDSRVELRKMVKDYWEMYCEGDVLILPRRYGGQSLQLNEAMSAGMLPVMLNVEPQKSFLSEELLVKSVNSKKIFTRAEIDCALPDPDDFAYHIDYMFNLPNDKIEELSFKSAKYANSIAWSLMQKKYLRLFKNLINEK